MINTIFSEKLKNSWIIPKSRKTGAYFIFANLGQNFQPYPIEAGCFKRVKKIENGPNFAYIEVHATGPGNNYWVEIELIVGGRSSGRARIPHNSGEHVPIPKILIEPFDCANLIIYLHHTETSELVQCQLSFSIVEVQQIEYAELLYTGDSRAIYIE